MRLFHLLCDVHEVEAYCDIEFIMYAAHAGCVWWILLVFGFGDFVFVLEVQSFCFCWVCSYVVSGL